MEAREQEALIKWMRNLWIVCASMVITLVMYIGVCHYFAERFQTRSYPYDLPIEMFKNIFYGLAVVSLFLAYFLRKLLLKVKVDNSSVKVIKATPARNQPPFIAKYFNAVIVSLTISESIGLYGFVLFFLGADFQTLYIFMAISAAAMFYFPPKIEELKELATATRSAYGGSENI